MTRRIKFESTEVELGYRLVFPDGRIERVMGWFFNGRGRPVILHGDRWHTYSRFEKLTRIGPQPRLRRTRRRRIQTKRKAAR